jgi:protein-disulfide isomerase
MKVAVAGLAAATLCLMPAATSAAKPAAVRDWSRSIVATPQGGFRMGNPAARVNLVEYGSLACPHCRLFEQTGYRPLVQGYVRTGRVSYEFRNFLLNAPDVSASLLAHCAGPAKFFPMSQVVYATQPQWFDKINGISVGQKAEIDKMSDVQRVVRFGELAGFPQIAARFGVTPARARQCLADPKGIERLLSLTKSAQDAGIHRTPTFLINGKQTDATTWDALEPELKKVGGS